MRGMAFIAAGLVLLPSSGADRAERDEIRVQADRTEVRALPGGDVVKEYRGNVRIWNRSVEAKSMRAVFESGAGVFRLFGSLEKGGSGRASITLFDEDGREKAVFTARNGALFVREGIADSASAEGDVHIFWKPRKARATASGVRWSASRRRIWADGLVTLTVDGIVERGREFEAGDDLKWYTMKRVSGSIRNPRRK